MHLPHGQLPKQLDHVDLICVQNVGELGVQGGDEVDVPLGHLGVAGEDPVDGRVAEVQGEGHVGGERVGNVVS